MGKNIKKSQTPSEVPGVIVTKIEESSISREPSRDLHSRSVSISRLGINDPLRKEMMMIREKSPFEIGENRNTQLASSKAIIDKALIMDVSGGVSMVDEYVSLFFSSGCVIDEAACKDISVDQNIEIVVVEQEEDSQGVTPPGLNIVDAIEENIKSIDYSENESQILANENLDEDQKIERKSSITLDECEVRENFVTCDDINYDITKEAADLFSEDILPEKEDVMTSHTEIETEYLTNAREETHNDVNTKENHTITEIEEYSTDSSSDESFEELVDPSLWKLYNSDDDDTTAWFYKRPDEVTQALTEKEKDEEFRKERLAKRCPVFLTFLTDRSGPEGSEIKLQSSIAGPETGVRWLKDDQLVERTSNLQTFAYDGLYSLILKNAQKSDSGIYTIIAKNRGGEVSSSAKVHVFENVKQNVEIPTIIKIRDYYHHALNDLIIECQVMFSPEWIIPDVTWLKADDPVIFDKRIRASYEGNEIFQLNIYNPTPEDSGIYTCIVKNIAGERRIIHEVEFMGKVQYLHLPGMHHADKKIQAIDELQEKEAKKIIIDQSSKRVGRSQVSEPYKEESYVIRDSKTKLTWAGQLKNITIQKGRTIKMICSVNGQEPILKWQKNNKPIDYGERIKLLNNGVVAQILIKDVCAADVGKYTCTAKNNYSEITTSCDLKVIELATIEISPPMFTKAIKEYYDLRSEDLVLETQIYGVPNPEIQWFKDGHGISYDDKCMLNREPNGKYQLRIHKPQPEDCGLYECRAKNNDGNATIKHEVKFNSNQQFVYAHRIEHVEKFKRQSEEELTFSSAIHLSNVENTITAKEVSETLAEGNFLVKESELPDSNDNPIEHEHEHEQPVEIAKQKPIPRKRAMPRRHYDEGPLEPFIIRDSKKKLTWETKLKNITAQEGKTIKLVCIVVGPQPQYKWFKNGKPLVWSKNVINSCQAEFGCVVIKNVSLLDAGQYTAQVKNPDTEIECSCNVIIFTANKEVQTAPTFTRISDYYDIRVNDLVVEVQVRGLPTPTLTWERDGREIKSGMDRIIIAREKDDVYRLSIHNPEKLDGGNWVIKASNSAGEDTIKHRMIFKGRDHYQHVPGIFHAELKLMDDDKDDRGHSVGPHGFLRAESTFSAASLPKESSVPVSNEKLNEILNQNVEAQIADNIDGMQASENKKKPQKREWRQKLSTLYSMEPLPKVMETVKPKTLDFQKKLFFETHLKNHTAAEGTTVKLVCSCIGPSPTFKWFKNNIPIVWSKTIKNETKLGVGAILILNSTLNDSGVYKCIASNNSGEIETSCKLTVYEMHQTQYEPPKFTRNVKEYYNVQVNDLILEVHVRGNPPPTIKWFRDGVLLDDLEGDKLFLLRQPDGVHKLTIHDPQRMDEGRYVCEAENIAGKDTIKYKVEKLNKEDYCHVHGILYHDQIMMKRDTKDNQKIETLIDRAIGEPREFVWMEDGSYYVRGQTPEHLWEWETDTSAESEYETLECETEGENKDQNEPIDDNQDENDENETDNKDVEQIIVSVKHHGPKIKKMRKKKTNQRTEINQSDANKLQHKGEHEMLEKEAVCITDTESSPIYVNNDNIYENTTQEESSSQTLQVDMPDVPKDEETLMKERYLRLFPEFAPASPKSVEDMNPLKFIIELRDITVAVGRSAKLFCTISGPKPDIKWQKGGVPLEFSKVIKNQSHDSTGIVNILKVSKSDEGFYTVVVKHKEYVITNTAKITVIEKVESPKGAEPRFITGISQHYDFRVNDLILETHIKGDGLLIVQWFLDGIAIENNEKYIQIREPMGVYKLCIHNPQIRDNGKYMVKVHNDFGLTEQQYHLRFEGKEHIPCHGIFHADPRRQYVDIDVKEKPREHREVVFFEDGSYYIRGQTPQQYWEWETDTSAESEYEPYISDSSPTTDKSEESADEEDKKENNHEEEHDDKDTLSETSDTKQDIDENDQTEQLLQNVEKVIKRGPKIKKLRKKRTVLTKTFPETGVSTILPKDDNVPAEKVQLDVDVSEVVHPKMKLSQRIASGESHQSEQVLKPKRKPIEVEFISHLRNQTLLKGKTVCLNCCCSDNQNLEVAWFKDGKKFEINKRCVSDVHFGFITLEIYRTTVEDSGCYECHVKTANGEAKDSCTISVFELPDKREVELVPPTFIHPIKETYHPKTNDLHLETRVRGNPVPTLSWVCDAVLIDHNTDKFEIFNQHYYELGTRITTATLIINKPQLKDSGKYTLVAKNDVQTAQITYQVNIGLRLADHKKKRMDDVVIANEAPRIIPKLPTPEPEITIQNNQNDSDILPNPVTDAEETEQVIDDDDEDED
ncbi:muscle M-line assembly protein unc-89-like [Sabethes cyaneus]|uniref:muscle M-line assembly protein unc-89-like n=1 Tax=Sabethes cyaneus TaxID=53552 RepID=UPI00237D5CDE|nr:muscle M-line assembly protein unc-89-like [Sabethes cyaneus]